MRKNIELLIASGITANQVANEANIARNTVYRIFNGEAALDNVSLKNAEILNEYYLKLKNAFNPIIRKLYKADNGDVLIQHNNVHQELTHVNVYDLKQMAIDMINNNEIEQCQTQAGEINGLSYLSYYTMDNVFIGTSDMCSF